MVKSEVLAKVKKLISEAKTEEAIDLLQEFFEKDPRYKKLYDLSVKIEGSLKRANLNKQKGVISFDEYNLLYSRANDNLVNLVGYTEANNLNPEGTNFFKKNKKGCTFSFTIALIGLLLIGAFFRDTIGLGGGENKPNPIDSGDEEEKLEEIPSCLPPNTFKVLVLPFLNIRNSGERLEGLIAERLNELKDSSNLDICIPILDGFETNRFLEKSEAERIGFKRGAEIIIWGRSENNDGLNTIKSGFLFLGEKKGLEFTQLEWSGNNQVKNLKSLSSIAEGGELTQDIEDLILLIFGIVAKENGMPNIALQNLEKANIPKDNDAFLIQSMAIADLQMEKGINSDAMATLDEVIETHPEYWLAWNNRAIINLENKQYLDAANDLTSLLSIRTKDSLKILETRGSAYLNAEKLKDAESDFKEANSIEPQNERVQEKLRDTQSQIKVQENIIDRSNRKIEKNPKDVDALQKKANAAKKLGRYKEAMEALRQANSYAPTNASNYVLQLEVAATIGDSVEVNKTLKEADQNGIQRSTITNDKSIQNLSRSTRAIIKN